MQTFIGIDVAKSTSSFSLNPSGSSQMPVHSFSMNAQGFQSLLETTQTCENPVYVMESTGRYHLTLLNFLLKHQRQTVMVNPVLIKQYTKANTLIKTKTDAIDARLIAEFAQHHPTPLPPAEETMIEERRTLARRREQLAAEIAKAKMQLKADLTVAFHELLNFNVFTHVMLSLLSVYPSPQSCWRLLMSR